jgi:photosystem II stability/assembly factor-like uncharacterized protein
MGSGSSRRSRWRRPVWLAAAVVSLVLLPPLLAQAPAAAQPQFTGIWEPVSYSEDLDLREVFFVTAERGWVAGAKGTILHTTDGGATWTAQLGGDPAAAEGPVTLLRFLDEYRGWAVRDARILHTEDGESWEDLGAAPQYVHALAMSSPTEGVAAGYLGMGRNPSTILKTRDGGRTWKPVTMCRVKAMVGGLNREFGCEVLRIQFVNRSVGYLVARHQCAGMGCAPPPILGKTEDGGESWRFFVGPGDVEVVGATDLFFTDAHTGIVRTTDGRLSRTTDGGATWKGLLASVPTYSSVLFADPEVGWAVEQKVDGKLTYTVDGGVRWNSRQFRFPTEPRAWSFPRRDRAYVVGDHGMVFRYRVVPAAEPVAPGVLVTVAMPGIASALDEQAREIEAVLTELGTVVESLPDSVPGAAPDPNSPGAPRGAEAPADPGLPPPSPEELQAEPFAPFVGNCCAPRVNRLGVIISAVAKSLPSFLERFRNTNLLVAGLRMATDMPGKFGDLRGAIRAFKQATDKGSAELALSQLGDAARALHQSTRVAFQRELPPFEPIGDLDVPSSESAAGALRAATGADSVASTAAKAAAEQAKKGIGGLIKKKIKIP